MGYEIGRRWARSELYSEALLNFGILGGGAGREKNWFGQGGERKEERCCQDESSRTGEWTRRGERRAREKLTYDTFVCLKCKS